MFNHHTRDWRSHQEDTTIKMTVQMGQLIARQSISYAHTQSGLASSFWISPAGRASAKSGRSRQNIQNCVTTVINWANATAPSAPAGNPSTSSFTVRTTCIHVSTAEKLCSWSYCLILDWTSLTHIHVPYSTMKNTQSYQTGEKPLDRRLQPTLMIETTGVFGEKISDRPPPQPWSINQHLVFSKYSWV